MNDDAPAHGIQRVVVGDLPDEPIPDLDTASRRLTEAIRHYARLDELASRKEVEARQARHLANEAWQAKTHAERAFENACLEAR